MRIIRLIPALLAVGVAVTGCEPGSITEARSELRDGPPRTLQLSIPVARKTFYVDSILSDFLEVTTITIANNLLAVEATEGSFGLDVGAITGPISGPLPPQTYAVQDGAEFVMGDLNLGEFDDAARDASVNTAFAVVTVGNQADVPATLTDFLVGIVRVDPITGYLDSVAGEPDWQTDGTGSRIQALVADGAGNTFDIPRLGTAVDTLQSALLVDRLVDMLLDGENVALVGAGDVTVGDGNPATISATDTLLVTLKPVIGLDFNIPPGGVSTSSSTTLDGFGFDARDADDIVSRLDSAVTTLRLVNATAFGVEATIEAVDSAVADVFALPPQDRVPIDVVTVSPATVNINGRVSEAARDTVTVNLSGDEVRVFLASEFTAGVSLLLLPPAGGRAAVGASDRISVDASVTLYVRTGGTP